jgi:hypothetical protein
MDRLDRIYSPAIWRIMNPTYFLPDFCPQGKNLEEKEGKVS